MQIDTGRIYDQDALQNLMENAQSARGELSLAAVLESNRLVPLEAEEAEKLQQYTRDQRKGYMRNKPCICGSGKKFKKCCWNTYGRQKEE